MLKKISTFFLLTLFFTFGKSYAQNNLSMRFENFHNPQKYPRSATFYDKDKKPVLLSDFDGKVIVLNFWQATCRTCLIELPSLNALAQKYPQIAVIAVSEGDETPEFIDIILHKQRRLSNIAVSVDDNKKMFKVLGGDKVPQTRLIDKNGVVRAFIKGGADFNSPEIHKQIEDLLNE